MVVGGKRVAWIKPVIGRSELGIFRGASVDKSMPIDIQIMPFHILDKYLRGISSNEEDGVSEFAQYTSQTLLPLADQHTTAACRRSHSSADPCIPCIYAPADTVGYGTPPAS